MGHALGVEMATEVGKLRSKVSTVLMDERPEHYTALKAAGVI
jgi:hypothetical protein